MRLRFPLGPGGDPNASALATPAGPKQTYEVSGGATGPTGQVIHDPARRFVAVIVTDGEDAQRALGGQRDRVALAPVEPRSWMSGIERRPVRA
jgi:hypothetical protein